MPYSNISCVKSQTGQKKRPLRVFSKTGYYEQKMLVITLVITLVICRVHSKITLAYLASLVKAKFNLYFALFWYNYGWKPGNRPVPNGAGRKVQTAQRKGMRRKPQRENAGVWSFIPLNEDQNRF